MNASLRVYQWLPLTTPWEGRADENHHAGPLTLPLKWPRLWVCLMQEPPLALSKQIHSSIVLPGGFQIPPTEPDFPPTFFFLIIKNTGHLPFQ